MYPISPILAQRIRHNYRGGELTAEDWLEIAEGNVMPGAERAMRVLLRLQASNPWRILRAHTEGSRDGTLHYTVFAPAGYHVRLAGDGHVFQVTGPDGIDLGTIPPWVRPGG